MTSGLPDFPASGDHTAWLAAVELALKGRDPVEALVARSEDGLAIGPLYPAGDGLPIQRGSQGCRVVQRIDHPGSSEANELALEDLEGGAGGLTLVLAGSPAARGFGLVAATRDDIAAILAGVRLDAIALRLEVDTAVPPPAWAAVATLAERDAPDASIDFGLDPLGTMARAGFVPDPWPLLAPTLGRAVDDVRAFGLRSPVLRADGRPHHEAGASQAQELAAVLASGVAYLRALDAAGHDLEDARGALSFALASDADVMLGVAKLRAIRRLWARVEEGCGLIPRPIALHAETAWRMVTRCDPFTNLLRGALGGAAALLGGADSVTVLPHTAALGLPDAFARRLARNAPLILAEEAGLGRVSDPAAGSGALEALTDALCGEAWRLFQAIERDGGMAAALLSGWWQDAVAAVRECRDATLLAGTRTIVGTTAFASRDESLLSVLPVHPQHPTTAPASGIRFPALASRRDAAPFEDSPV